MQYAKIQSNLSRERKREEMGREERARDVNRMRRGERRQMWDAGKEEGRKDAGGIA